MKKIIEMEALYNGGHRNQTIPLDMDVPSGWAMIPEELETDNFPFGSFEVEEVDGVPTVTKWVAGDVPEAEPEPIDKLDQIRADIEYLALMTEVDL